MSSNNPNTLNFMSVLAVISYYSSANKNYEHHTHNKSLISDEHYFFHAFDSFSMLVENNDLNFNEFIINCKVINYTSISNRVEERSNVEDNLYDNVDEFVVKRISQTF